ncbi:MAG: InlB B-repeat-containing protein [Clostridia bacterium]|nr:InlB B-repeat-containing protein [Clostridia bacterium]
MKKKINKSMVFGIVALVMLIAAFIFFICFIEFMWDDLCESHRVKVFEQEVVIGDFICQEYDGKINLKGLSEEGKLKSHIIIPQTIDDKKVSIWGYKSALLSNDVGKWESQNLKKIYVLGDNYVYSGYARNKDMFGKCPLLEKIVFVNKDNRDLYLLKAGDRTVFVNYQDYCDYYAKSDICGANVSYHYNYEDAPNDGYYWLDDIDGGKLIDFIPEDPKREGYIFDGWYKEEECLNKWDFRNDLIHKAEYFNDFIENRLYAKWIKE